MSSSSNRGVGYSVLFSIALAVVAGAIGFIIATLAVGTDSRPDNSSDSALSQTEENTSGVDLPLQNLEGEWRGDMGTSVFLASVDAKSIEIKLINGDTSAIYWNGTFGIVEADGALTSAKVDNGKMVLSRADSKKFLYDGKNLSFDFEAMGVTTKVGLSRA